MEQEAELEELIAYKKCKHDIIKRDDETFNAMVDRYVAKRVREGALVETALCDLYLQKLITADMVAVKGNLQRYEFVILIGRRLRELNEAKSPAAQPVLKEAK